MNIISPAIIIITVFVASFIIGRGLFPYLAKRATGLSLVGGLMVLWALFFAVSIPVILFQRDGFGMNAIVLIYAGLAGALILTSFIMLLVRVVNDKETLVPEPFVLDIHDILYLALFTALVAFQLYKALFFAYADGDDAYYVAVSQSLGGGLDSLYINDPYTGVLSGITYRYALAPFPVWVAFFTRVFNVNAATVAHVCMPAVLIPITYVIYNAVGEKLFAGNKTKKYMFMCLIAVFVMFSNYSFYPAEVFLLTRARQGKEALANIIIPFLIYQFIDIAQEEDYKIPANNYIMIILIAISGALTSVFGNLLVLVALFGNFVYSFLRHAPIKEKIKAASLAVPNLLVLALYVVL